jgi:hypothetical protein
MAFGHRVASRHLSPRERRELMLLLEQILSKHEHGDGVITFKDNILPRNAQSIADHDGALLLVDLRRIDELRKPTNQRTTDTTEPGGVIAKVLRGLPDDVLLAEVRRRNLREAI